MTNETKETDQMAERVEKAEKGLLDRGYVEVPEYDRLQVGQRVRHIGEQWSEAYHTGTGVIEKIFYREKSSWGANDVELIVKRDKPRFGPNDTHGYWASYHTIVVNTEEWT